MTGLILSLVSIFTLSLNITIFTSSVGLGMMTVIVGAGLSFPMSGRPDTCAASLSKVGYLLR